MAAELSSTVQALEQVFDLILFNVEKIVDDTSLEKLLEILNFTFSKEQKENWPGNGITTTTLKFMSQLHGDCSAKTVSFALRLSGIICSSCEGFYALVAVDIGGGNILEYLFHDIYIKKRELWSDPVIRDSYFKAAFGILESNDGFVWIQNSEIDIVQVAMNSLVDNSIFVADSVRKFIAKYLITLYISSLNKDNAIDNVLQDLARHNCLKTRSGISKDVTKCYKCIISHLKYLIEQSPCGLTRTMSSQVSVSQLLLSMMEDNPKNAQEILSSSGIMTSCFQLLHLINKDECGKVIDVILTMLTNTSSWNINWLVLLNLEKGDLFYTLLEFILVLHKRLFMFHAFQLIQGLFCAGHSLQFDDSWLCSLFILLSFPVHATLHKFETKPDSNFVKWNVKETAKEFMATDCLNNDGWKVVHKVLNETMGSPSNTTVSQSLAVTVEIIRDIKLCYFPRLSEVIQIWCKNILDFLNLQRDGYFSGNTLIKLFIKAITACIEQRLLDGHDNAKKQSYQLFVKLLHVSKDSKILSDCFEGLVSLFLKTTPDHIASYLNEDTGDQITLKQLLSLHCSNSCWSVRDSTLSFLRFLVMTFDVAIIQLLLDQTLLLLLWKLMSDPESYVRASSIRVLAVISRNDIIWKNFCETISLSEQEILEYIANAFEEEEAAFARRTTMDLFTFWLVKEHNIIWTHLRDSNSESFTSTPLFNVLRKARQDFDWEVKLRVLNFMETLLHRGEKLRQTIGSRCLDEISAITLAALTDCDKPVRIKGFSLLEELKTYAQVCDLDIIKDVLHYDGSLDGLQDFIFDKKERKNCSLLDTLLAIDFSKCQPNFHDSNFFLNPLPFLKDIVAAATDNQHNLLDCY